MVKKYYYTEFEIQCGEFEFSDHSIIEAENIEQAELILDDYLLNYAGDGRKYDDKVYQYYGGEWGTKYHSLREMTKDEIKEHLFKRFFINEGMTAEQIQELVDNKNQEDDED